jgi:hypothetical protein
MPTVKRVCVPSFPSAAGGANEVPRCNAAICSTLGSTIWRQPGIVVNVWIRSPRTLKRHHLSFLGRVRMDNLLKAHT